MSPIPRPNIHPPVKRISELSSRETTVAIAVGSNLGDREAIIRAAIAALDAAGVRVGRVSTLIESVAVTLDGEDAAASAYLNGALIATTTLSPLALLTVVNTIEADLGRVRAMRWGDRTIDLDIIAYGHRVIDEPTLTVPHPRAAERDFVLRPLAEIAPELELPGYGAVSELLAALDTASGDEE